MSTRIQVCLTHGQWTGFVKFTLLNEKTSQRIHVVKGATSKIQPTTRPDSLWPEFGPACRKQRRKSVNSTLTRQFFSTQQACLMMCDTTLAQVLVRVIPYMHYMLEIWKGDILCADIDELGNLDSPEIHARRLNANEIITSKNVKQLLRFVCR